MKRWTVLLLAALLLWSCASPAPETSLPAAESSVPTEESSASEESTPEEFVLSEDVALIDSFMTEEIDRTLKVKNVFMDLPYTFNRPASDKYPDTNLEKLTNCDTMDVVYGGNTYVGWDGGQPVTVTFDLTGKKLPIGDISVGCARIADYGVNLPLSVTVQASHDGKEFTDVGKISTPQNLPNTTKYTYYFAFPKALQAEYLRIVFSIAGSGYMVTDEIFAYQYCEDGLLEVGPDKKVDYRNPISDFYEYNLNLGESDVQVSPSDEDYSTYRNLATIPGVDFQIQHFDPFFLGHTNSGRAQLHLLTDGVRHGDDSAKDYFIFYRGTGRHLIADLGKVMRVEGCALAFWDKPSWGIATPPVYYISLSENGTDWVTVYAEHNPEYGVSARVNDLRECVFADAYLARYVRVTFPTVPDNGISSSVYLGEFEIYGTKDPAGAVPAVEEQDTPYGKYPDPEKFGISDILWAGVGDDYGVVCENYHVITEDTAYHYLTTVDENGKAADPLFDTFCFTSRGSLSWYADRTEGYTWYLSEVFRDGVNMDALDAAQGRINKEKGTTVKAPAFISVNCPVIGDTFEGKTIQTEEDYIACMKWMADSAIEAFNAKNYENVYLAGFYWQVENLRPNHWAPGAAHDIETAKAFNEYVHELGYLSLWLPYYSYLNGIWHSHYYGFDITCWQPNYVFSATEPTRMDTIAELAKLYGVGIEIEFEAGRQSKEVLALYREYLGAGYEYGFMNGINAYYQGAVPGAFVTFREDKDPINKTIYEETVLFAQGKLEKDPRTTETADLSSFTDHTVTVQNGKKAVIELGELPETAVQFALTPLYGTVRLNPDGDLTYLAMRGYAGKDTVKITLYDGKGGSKTITIDVTVTE